VSRVRQRKVAERSELSRAGRLVGGCLGLVLVPVVWQLLQRHTHSMHSTRPPVSAWSVAGDMCRSLA
jgi:hypothetical protein